MTEPRHGTGASGWCLARKRCHECAFPACTCPCHEGSDKGANPPVVWDNWGSKTAPAGNRGLTPNLVLAEGGLAQ